MDITSTAAVNTNTIGAATTIKTPEAESETPTRILPVKSLSLSNGVLKRHQPLNHRHHHHHHHHHGFSNHHPVVVTYKECLKNHAASLGGHAVDGCGEFMPSPTANPNDPTSLKCAACGCHRNFHRREPEEPVAPPNTTAALEYQPHHRHHPLPPPHRNSADHSSPSSPSPPPISSSFYPSAPHMLLALSSGLSALTSDNATPMSAMANTGSSRKRFRTKFSQDQKDKMLEFAEKVGWKMQKRDEELISSFCNEVGVDRGVLKVWMHNNKNNLGKKDHNSNTVTITSIAAISATNINNRNGNGFGTASGTHYHQHDDNNNNDDQMLNQHHLHHSDIVGVAQGVVSTNGSSSSS